MKRNLLNRNQWILPWMIVFVSIFFYDIWVLKSLMAEDNSVFLDLFIAQLSLSFITISYNSVLSDELSYYIGKLGS